MTARAERAEAALTQCQHDLAEMIERKEVLRNWWEGAEAALAEMTTLHKDREDDLAFEYARAERAEAALAVMTEQKEYFRQVLEVAEAALAEPAP